MHKKDLKTKKVQLFPTFDGGVVRLFYFCVLDELAATSYEYELLLSAADAIEKQVPARGSQTQSYLVPAGSAIVWKARVMKGEIGFCVREVNESAPDMDVESVR